MKTQFSIEENEFGVVVRGPLPASDLKDLGRMWEQRGLTEMAIGVAAALGATLAITSKGRGKAWIEEVEKEAAHNAGGDAELEWLLGADTGSSSLTIFSVLSSLNGKGAKARLGKWGASFPHDPDDFGRCHRLLEKIPAWRPRLAEVVAKHGLWGPLVREWDGLTELYLEELPSGRALRLYDRMKVLIDEGRAEVAGLCDPLERKA